MYITQTGPHDLSMKGGCVRPLNFKTVLQY